MKVLHVPFTYHPDPVGGTEVYVESLSRELAGTGVESVVAAPGHNGFRYEHDGVTVHRFGTSQHRSAPDLYAEDPAAAEAFCRVLDRENPAVLHLHAFTREVSTLLVDEARRRGISVVYTYHTPAGSCMRQTLLRWGTDLCDGTLKRGQCAACVLEERGLNRYASIALGAMPIAAGRALDRIGARGPVATALQMSHFVERRHAQFRNLTEKAHRIVCVCGWGRDVLIRNGVPAAKITHSPLGLPWPARGHTLRHQPGWPDPPLRIVFLGRLHRTKGIHVLLSVFRECESLEATLDIFGVVQGAEEAAYAAFLKTAAAGDSRIRFREPVAPSAVVSLLEMFDILAVPSQWMETGPLVVLEAFAAGIPVIGSRLGGLMELVRHGVDGLLVDPYRTEDWRAALTALAADPELVGRLRAGVRFPRTMATVAREMAELYHSVSGVRLARAG